MANDSPIAPSSVEVLERRGVEQALEVAVRAPSIHNTQPWRWELGPGGLALLADRDRQLGVGDPDGHSLLVSCGAALALTELALRAQGWLIQTARLPDPANPDVLALLRPVGRREPGDEVHARVQAARRRRSDRLPFSTQQVSDETLEALRAAGSGPHVNVHFPIQAGQGIDLAVAVSWADRVERDDRAYADEMHRWIGDPNVRHTSDGVPIDAVPHVSPGHLSQANLPEASPEPSRRPSLLLVASAAGVALVGGVLPTTPLAGALGFTPAAPVSSSSSA
ncbi:MAG: hypothetical protein JWN61_1994 [Pseudonocardiales bacterium]|nr:hypothetical protein [Pseudonocardiales bacterium]